MKRPSSRSGLTLVEVMLALTILSVGLFAMITAASRCLGVARKAKNFESARHLLARAELEKPLQLEEEVEEGTESGRFDGKYAGFSWQRTVTMVGEEEDGLYSLEWTVNWSDAGRKASESVITYVHVPFDQLGGTVESPIR